MSNKPPEVTETVYINMDVNAVHVVPVNDLRVHTSSASCWCMPVETEDDVFMHNSLDGREKYETGERKPN